MTIYEEQLMLDLLGCNPNAEKPPKTRRTFVDGIDGQQTQKARQNFQKKYGYEPTETNLRTAIAEADKSTLAETPEGVVTDTNVGGKTGTTDETDIRSSLTKYLQQDGYYHIPKGINIPVSEHFTSGEYDCRCNRRECNVTVLHPALLDAVEDFRKDVNRPVTITTSGGSGFRCKAHNADPNVGGAAGSLHTLGLAADLKCTGISVNQMAAIAEKRKNYGEIGKYSWGIHLGVFRPDGKHTRWDNRGK